MAAVLTTQGQPARAARGARNRLGAPDGDAARRFQHHYQGPHGPPDDRARRTRSPTARRDRRHRGAGETQTSAWVSPKAARLQPRDLRRGRCRALARSWAGARRLARLLHGRGNRGDRRGGWASATCRTSRWTGAAPPNADRGPAGLVRPGTTDRHERPVGFETVVTTVSPDDPTARSADGRALPRHPGRADALQALDHAQQHPLADSRGLLNVVTDTRVFAGCVTGRRDWPVLPAMSVPGACASRRALAPGLNLIRATTTPSARCCAGLRARGAARRLRGLNRARAAVVEDAVLVNRLAMLPPRRWTSDALYLPIAIDKTAGPGGTQTWDCCAPPSRHTRLHPW